MTTGSRGLHVLVPLRHDGTYDVVHRLAADIAARFAEHDPKRLTVEFRRDRRGERIFVDVGRNAYGQHAVAPYAVRALPSAPVATPLHWAELDGHRLDPQSWTVTTIAERLAADGDPWRGLARHARGLARAWRALAR